jgi:hypothetical protein
MSDIVLPKEVQYITPAALPECQTQQVVLSPINSTTLGPSSLIQFDLPSRGYLVPDTMYLRYKTTVLNKGGNAYTGSVRGTPVYTFFSKLQTYIGGSTAETINNFHQTCNTWMNLQLDVAEKYGSQYNFGYDSGQVNMAAQDGRSFTATPIAAQAAGTPGSADWTMAGFLPCCLSQAQKLIPMHSLPGVRIELSTAAASDVFSVQLTADMTYILSNVELVYDIVNFTNEVDDMVRSQGEKLYIKTQSFQNIGTPIASGFNGNTEVIFNTRLASIKSLFAIFNPSYASSGAGNLTVANGLFDSIDITSSSGSLQWTVAATQYPTREVSTLNSKAAVMLELKKACGSMSATHYSTSINIPEFSYTDEGYRNHVVGGLGTVAPSVDQPGKFYFGVNTEKLNTDSLLTGISTQNSPLSLRINTSKATSGNYMVYMIALFDQLLIIDPAMRSCEVKQ